ncbi:hypothetical protein J6590_074882 [Homalodisca vitripennis]|nr:hypothetical protein J6590_074882 [Homalodisca vitripennis]
MSLDRRSLPIHPESPAILETNEKVGDMERIVLESHEEGYRALYISHIPLKEKILSLL